MQEIKNTMKKLGEHLQHSNPSHEQALRQKLLATQSQAPVQTKKLFFFSPAFAWGAGCCVIVLAALVSKPLFFKTSGIDPEEYAMDSYSFIAREADMADGAGVVMNAIVSRMPENVATQKDEDVIDYEEQNGAMLEQTVSVRLLTQEKDASETVATLFASLGGHLASIRENDDAYATITGSIPATRMDLFYEGINDLVKNENFMEKNVQGDSVTSEALDLADRETALRTAEKDATAQLQAAKTTEEQAQARATLESISNQLAQIDEQKKNLEDRVDYVTVSVSIEKLPAFWSVQNAYQLNEYIAGYENPTLWQEIEINVLTVFFLAARVFSVAFWVIIPLGIAVAVFFRRRTFLRQLE